MKILIVDDIEANLYLLRVLLLNAGYDVVEAENGKVAIEVAEVNDVDLVVSDILMPTMDGFEFCKIWKHSDKFKNIPFIFYTATYTEQKDREFSLNLGADLFLVKPMESYNLLREISKVLENAQVNPPAEAVAQSVIGDANYYEEYSSVLVGKLEAKLLQLEQKNYELMQRDANLHQLNDSLKFQLSKVQLTEANLREHEKELLSMVNSMAEGVLTTDDRGVVYEFNPAAEKVFGYSRSEIVGKGIEILLPLHIRSQHEGLLSGYVASDKDQIILRDVLGCHKSGDEVPIRFSIVRLPQADLKRQMFLCTFLDVSKEKQQEKLLSRTQKMEAIGTLSGGVAHDYNNMLGVILGYAGLLREDTQNSQHQGYIDNITYAAERGASLARKLLSFSKKSNESIELVDVNQVINDNRDMLSKVLMARVELSLDLSDEIPEILIERHDVEDCLLNLCINAKHAMPEGGRLSIKTRSQVLDKGNEVNLAAGKYLYLSIEDNGCGMTAEVSGKVFDPFFSTKGEEGTGLGLSQVYGFVKRSKGFVGVESEVGRGTRFNFYFPESTHLVEKSEQEQTSADRVIDGEYTIMVVDDEPSLLTLINAHLSNFGCDVVTANNADDALEKLSAQTVDLLLSDVIMPGIDGFKLISIVKDRYPEIKTLLMSGFNEIDGHHLQKPFSKNELCTSVEALLKEG